MADNPYKRDMVNAALMILNAGRTADTGVLFDSIDDTEFANWTTVNVNVPDKRIACFCYERILKLVLARMRPDFACDYADLGQPRKVNKDDGGWDYLFELPTDYLSLVYQCDESNPTKKAAMDRDPEVLHLKGYSHVVTGTDGQAYSCSVNHTSADATKPITGATYAAKWTLYSTDGSLGATWAANVAYEYNATGPMLASNALTNKEGTSAYIKYVAYARAGRSDQPQYYPDSFANAFATRLGAEMALNGKDYKRRTELLTEFESLAMPDHWAVENSHKGRVRQLTAFERRTR